MYNYKKNQCHQKRATVKLLQIHNYIQLTPSIYRIISFRKSHIRYKIHSILIHHIYLIMNVMRKIAICLSSLKEFAKIMRYAICNNQSNLIIKILRIP